MKLILKAIRNMIDGVYHYVDNIIAKATNVAYVYTLLIEEQTVAIDVDSSEEYDYESLDGGLYLEQGKVYAVTLNGKTYTCTAWYMEYWESVCLGNGSVIGQEGGDDAPFLIDSYPDGSIYLEVASSGEYTISISSVEEGTRTLDKKYLPEDAKSDWDQNDSAAIDYVKNRTHSKIQMTDALHYPTEKINVEELGVGTHLIFTPANEARFLRWYVFSEMRYGVTFAFAFDYSCISGNEQINVNCTPETLMDNTSYNLIDSKNYSFRTPIGTVFVILDTSILEEDRRALYPEIGIYLQVSNDSTRAERCFTLKVFKFVKLSEAYIPGTIARTDYVDQKTVTDTTLTVEGAAADAKAVGDRMAEKISAPATASVGQTIRVSAVDENGKPTAWEAVDTPVNVMIKITLTDDSIPTAELIKGTYETIIRAFEENKTIHASFLYEHFNPDSNMVTNKDCNPAPIHIGCEDNAITMWDDNWDYVINPDNTITVD